MSRAFVNEDKLADSNPLPERRVSEHPNYVTPRGLELLRQTVHALTRERGEVVAADSDDKTHLAEIDRDLRYFQARLNSAKPVPPPPATPDKVGIGCAVTCEDAEGTQIRFTLVGEDEADAANGLLSWVSPLGNALLGREIGDQVIWRRAGGDAELEVVEIGGG